MKNYQPNKTQSPRPRMHANSVWLFFLLILGYSQLCEGQNNYEAWRPIIDSNPDSIFSRINLDQIVINRPLYALPSDDAVKRNSSVEEYLLLHPNVDLIRRGAYAWEPSINGMMPERSIITIDGMRIFGACTDRMDPITSYVDVSNLQSICIEEGQSCGSSGHSTAGSIDLNTRRGSYGTRKTLWGILTGFESTNSQKILGADILWRDQDFYVKVNALSRNAEDYRAGGNRQVPFSAYRKWNASLALGWRVGDHEWEGQLIIDQARDIGYPALPMDVSRADAHIASLTYRRKIERIRTNLMAKVYLNSVIHIMDDSQRDAIIRMDMPGKSKTGGFIVDLTPVETSDKWKIKWDVFVNSSYAEMTMYPNVEDEKEMFMLTWPDVQTYNSGLFAENGGELKNWHWTVSARLSAQVFDIRSDMGLRSIQIFYPNAEKIQSRALWSISNSWEWEVPAHHVTLTAGFGNRPPSVSEGFGYYLYNSFDGYDYLGSPLLRSEWASELTAAYLSDERKSVRWGARMGYTRIVNYIMATTVSQYSAMTPGARGVRQYINLPYANFFNAFAELEYDFLQNWLVAVNASYNYGVDHTTSPLPLIRPIAYSFRVDYRMQSWKVGSRINGNATQVAYNSNWGEDRTPAFSVMQLYGSKKWAYKSSIIELQCGVDNLFDSYYSTYSDWNNLPQMGRNVFVNLNFNTY